MKNQQKPPKKYKLRTTKKPDTCQKTSPNPIKKRKAEKATESSQSPKKMKTEKRIKQETPNPREKENYTVQIRSNLVASIRLLKNVKFNKGQLKELKRSPFWHLINAINVGQLGEQAVKKSDNDIIEVIKRYRRGRAKFKLGKTVVRLKERDIALVFGIECGEKRMNLSRHALKPKTSFVKRWFSDDKRINASTLKNHFSVALKGKTRRDNKDLARLVTLYFCVTIFFATSGPTLGWSFIEYVERVKKMKSFAWATAITDALLAALDKKCDRPETISGCAIALLYWLCEHTTLLPPNDGDSLPRVLKWTLAKLTEVLKQNPLDGLSPMQVITAELQPTKQELDQLKFVKEEGELDDSDKDEEGADLSEFITRKAVEPSMKGDDNSSFELRRKVALLMIGNKKLNASDKKKAETIMVLEKSVQLLENEKEIEKNAYENKLAERDATISSLETEKKSLIEQLLEMQVQKITQEYTIQPEVDTPRGTIDPLQTENLVQEIKLEEKEIEIEQIQVKNKCFLEDLEEVIIHQVMQEAVQKKCIDKLQQENEQLFETIEEIVTDNVTQEMKDKRKNVEEVELEEAEKNMGKEEAKQVVDFGKVNMEEDKQEVLEALINLSQQQFVGTVIGSVESRKVCRI